MSEEIFLRNVFVYDCEGNIISGPFTLDNLTEHHDLHQVSGSTA